tara:strand:+ start:202 stop:597 length:396 start_codon:yes stop_codon:yes gene_type:complete
MQKKIKREISSNKSFGIVFFFVFLIISLWPLLNENPLRVWSLIIAIVFLILGLMDSKLLDPLNIIWFKFGKLLGLIIAPIVMGIIFFAIVTPTGLIMKLLGNDLLNYKYKNKNKSYWINREKQKSTMRQQF